MLCPSPEGTVITVPSGKPSQLAGRLPLLDDLLQLALERLYGLLRGYLALEGGVVLLRQLQGHIRVVRRDRAWRGVVYNRLLAEASDGHFIQDLLVLVEAPSGGQPRSFDRACLELLRVGHELDELPGLLLLVRGGVDKEIPPTEGAVALVASAHRDRRDTHLFRRIYVRLFWIAQERVHVGPVAQKDHISPEKGAVRLRLSIVEHSLVGDAVLYHAVPSLETAGRLRAVYDHLRRVVGVENIPAVGPDVLAAVAHSALVFGPLEGEPGLSTSVLLGLEGHLLQLLPGRRCLGKAALLQQVPAVVEKTRVRVPRDAPDLAVVGVRPYRPGQERVGVGETVGEVEDVAASSELGWPDDVPSDHVYLAAPSLELGPQLVEVLTRILGHLPVGDLDLALVLLVELLDQCRQGSGVVLSPGEDEFVSTSLTATAAPRRPKERGPREPRPAEPQEVLAAELRATPSAVPHSLHAPTFPCQLFGSLIMHQERGQA